MPSRDSRYQGGAQKVPGLVLCAYYDLGCEGVAYHDSDPKNHGSGELNPADGTYLNEFRIHEGVDTSYTKFQRKPDPIDDSPFNKIVPPADLLYVGSTEPGEWFNVTVDVTRIGTYVTDFLAIPLIVVADAIQCSTLQTYDRGPSRCENRLQQFHPPCHGVQASARMLANRVSPPARASAMIPAGLQATRDSFQPFHMISASV